MIDKNKFKNEIVYIINGIKRPFDTDEILKKYGIIDSLPDYKIISPFNKTIHDNIITIDRTKTYLRDDAISIKKDGYNYIISIHVADVASEILYGSDADICARNNFKCLYIPKSRTNMYKLDIENKLSLNKNKLRRVITLNVILNDSGDILNYNLSRNNIVVSNNLSYNESDKIINYLSENEYYKSLNDLYMISKALEYKNKNKRDYW